MDGNGRWAKEKNLPRLAGHNEGINSVREIVRICGEIEVISCIIIDAEIYGRIVSAKIVIRPKAPPENMLNIPKTPLFVLLTIYMGVPLSTFFGRAWFLTALYVVYWYTTVLWWYYYSFCYFDRCLLSSSATSISLLSCMSYFFYSHEWMVTTWLPMLCWSFFTLYISIWYHKSYSTDDVIAV